MLADSILKPEKSFVTIAPGSLTNSKRTIGLTNNGEINRKSWFSFFQLLVVCVMWTARGWWRCMSTDSVDVRTVFQVAVTPIQETPIIITPLRATNNILNVSHQASFLASAAMQNTRKYCPSRDLGTLILFIKRFSMHAHIVCIHRGAPNQAELIELKQFLSQNWKFIRSAVAFVNFSRKCMRFFSLVDDPLPRLSFIHIAYYNYKIDLITSRCRAIDLQSKYE